MLELTQWQSKMQHKLISWPQSGHGVEGVMGQSAPYAFAAEGCCDDPEGTGHLAAMPVPGYTPCLPSEHLSTACAPGGAVAMADTPLQQ